MFLNADLGCSIRLLVLAGLVPVMPAMAADALYTLNATGTGNFLRVDPITGAATPIAPTLSLGAGSWSGLSSQPIDSSVVYAVNNPRPATFGDPQFSRLARIDVGTATATLFPLFDGDALGSPEIFSSGIAISLLEPNVATVVGSDLEIPPQPMLWQVNLDDGSIATPAKPLTNVRRIESLTFGPDGSALFGADEQGRLVTIDPSTADVSVVGDPGLSDFITGLAFDSGGALYAIEGLRQDRLVTLDPNSGELLSIVGPLGISGPEGLAFIHQAAGVDLDCNSDGVVDTADLDCANAADITPQLLTELRLLPGDLDGRNGVDFKDFLVLALNFGTATESYTKGDIDDSGRVDFPDFLTQSNNFGQAHPMATVPEPANGLPFAMLLVAGRLLRVIQRQVICSAAHLT